MPPSHTPRAPESAARQNLADHWKLVLALAVAPLLLTACGGGSSPADAPTPPPVTPAAPSITTQPAAAAVQAGQTATFSVAATGSGTLSYQWYRDTTAIAGATAASYTTALLSVADNGATFSVRVTGTGGTSTSTGASLSVVAAPVGVAPKVIQLSVSERGYALAVRADGSVIQWGSGMQGGTGTAVAGTTARLISGVNDAVGVSTGDFTSGGGNRSLVVTRDGSVWGWGRNWRGSLGVTYTGDDNLIVQNATKILQLSAVTQTLACTSGSSVTYALRADGSVWLMPGVRSSSGVVTAAPLNGLPAIEQLVLADTSGFDCTLLAIASNGTVWRAVTRQSDFDSTLQRYTLLNTVEQDLIAPPRVSQLSCLEAAAGPSRGHCLAVTTDGKLWAWGQNDKGQLGLGDQVSRTLAAEVAGPANIKKVLAVLGYSFALTTSGELHVWGGFNGSSMMAGRTSSDLISYSDFWRPGLAPGINNIDDLAIAPYGQFVTALKKDGTIWSWGINVGGVFGDGTTGNETGVPTQALGLSLR